jgi:OmcA/MtrC family decaheme c-type cytochrome
MNRKDDAYPIYFPWVANPANAAANAGANCEACHVTGGSSYYPVDPTQVFATSIAAGPYQTPSATVPPGTPGTTPAVGPQDDIAITPNVAACGSCHTSQTDQSHMQQNGGITAAWQAAQNNGQGTPIKAANGSTLVQYQTEACAVCHGPGAISDVKLAHKIASFY